MLFREAQISDIPQLQVVRNAVLENTLSDPSLVTNYDVEDYISRRGKGWVCESNGIIIGSSIVSVIDKNIWALFVHPGYDKSGIGRRLHDGLLEWYFAQTNETRAEHFYRKAGWVESGTPGKEEIKFAMTAAQWKGCFKL